MATAGMPCIRAMQNGKGCVSGVCPLVPAALPCRGGCGSPAVEEARAPALAAARWWRYLRAVPPPPFGLRAVTLPVDAPAVVVGGVLVSAALLVAYAVFLGGLLA